jgi:hypothetical protein
MRGAARPGPSDPPRRPAGLARTSLLLCLGLLAAATALAAGGSEETWIIEPGVRVGPVTAGTSEAALRKQLGPQIVRTAAIEFGEGETESGTILYPDDPEKKLEILWKDEKTRARPRHVLIRAERTRWHTPQGITLGTPLAEIEKLNGRPVYLFTGWETDCGGQIIDAGGGKLTFFGKMVRGKDDEIVDVQGQTLELQMSMTEAVSDEVYPKLTEAEKTSLIGCEKAHRSDAPLIRRLRQVVVEITANFP